MISATGMPPKICQSNYHRTGMFISAAVDK